MIKSVQQVGTEQIAGLPERIRAVTPLIEQVLKNSADRVSLVWTLSDRGLPHDHTLELTLTDDLAGTRVGYFAASDFDRDVKRLRDRVRELHMDVLERALEESVEKIKRNLAESMEA